MNIKKLSATISRVTDLSPTAKEIEFTLPQSLEFTPGSFVNVFMTINGVTTRRAYSISSSFEHQSTISVAMRLLPGGTMSSFFWNQNMIGTQVEIMGPLGINTVEKMHHDKVYLFAFGVGAGVVKSIADFFSRSNVSLVIVTGSRSKDEILYRDYFDQLTKKSNRIRVVHVVSNINDGEDVLEGYIQHHIKDFDFNDSDVYICGQEIACKELVDDIKAMQPENCTLLVEAFH